MAHTSTGNKLYKSALQTIDRSKTSNILNMVFIQVLVAYYKENLGIDSPLYTVYIIIPLSVRKWSKNGKKKLAWEGLRN